MIRTKIALAVGLGLVALLAVTPVANAKDQKGPRPDLVIGKVSKPPASNTVGSKLKVTVKVTNRGNVKAAKSRVALYLAKSKKHKAKDRPLKRAKVKALRPDKSAKAKLKLVLPASSTPGTYRLIACADDRKQVRESKEGDNCIATKAFKLKAIAVQSPPAPTPPAAPAFRMTDSIDWGFIEDANLNEPEPGDPVTATLSAANGIAGQAGYVRSGVASQPLVAGATTSFDYSGANNSEDDGAVTINLPFAFPFGGISESSVSIGTNGWMSFGSPALDYWDDSQTSDYRGTDAVVGNFERGIMTSAIRTPAPEPSKRSCPPTAAQWRSSGISVNTRATVRRAV